MWASPGPTPLRHWLQLFGDCPPELPQNQPSISHFCVSHSPETGSADRPVPARLLREGGLKRRHGGQLFLTDSGRPWTVANLSRTFRRLRNRLGLPSDLCLYLTRHEHGTKICQAKGIHAAARALGHASIQTTERYVKDDDQELRDTQDLFSD